MTKLKELLVTAFWDDEAKVWVAESDEVPGLITEAETVDIVAREASGSCAGVARA